jgi:hypothetical protein
MGTQGSEEAPKKHVPYLFTMIASRMSSELRQSRRSNSGSSTGVVPHVSAVRPCA